MKKISLMFFWVVLITLMATSCEKMENINTDPNNPQSVPSNMVFSGAQKRVMDFVYDVWFSGRQSLVYSQYWAQRNYTEEDRYQIRESVNNNYFNVFYTMINSFNRVIELNSDPKTAPDASLFGANKNQIAAAKIMKAWMFSIITDTWGSVPYFEVGKLKDDVYFPKYDDQAEIYKDLIKELTEAANMIDEGKPVFTSGDMIYDGDASQWKKFANSLKCRLALHTSKVDNKWRDYIDEALLSGVFESNDDAAAYHYSATAPEWSLFYEGTFIDMRNDFTITRPFMDILKGVTDSLNVDDHPEKIHPWEGTVDPRLAMFTTQRRNAYDDYGTDDSPYENIALGAAAAGTAGVPFGTHYYIGMPYGIPTANTSTAFRNAAPNWYATPPMHLKSDFPVPIMTYAEVQFIISERNGFSAAEYAEGVEASIDYWSSVSGVPVSDADKAAYLDEVTKTVDAEAVALQKYIDLYMNGTEAWVEIRRTGYPDQLLKPGELSAKPSNYRYEESDKDRKNPIFDGYTEITFTPLSVTKGLIIPRVKYPTNESTLNGASFKAAVSKLEDGTNNYYSPMFWDKRRTEGPHPANK